MVRSCIFCCKMPVPGRGVKVLKQEKLSHLPRLPTCKHAHLSCLPHLPSPHLTRQMTSRLPYKQLVENLAHPGPRDLCGVWQSAEYGRTRRDLMCAEPFCDKRNERLDKKLVCAFAIFCRLVYVCVGGGRGGKGRDLQSCTFHRTSYLHFLEW